MQLRALVSMPSRTRLLPALGAALALLFFTGSAAADDAPFDLESSSWMSFDRYKEKPANWLAPDQRSQAAAQPVVVAPPTLPASMPPLTEPTRAVIAPVMPGLNRNFDIRVNSTADDHQSLPIQSDNNKDNPEIGVPGNEWKDAVEAARTSTLITAKDDSNPASFNVRYTALPTWLKPPARKPPAMTPVQPPVPAVKIAQPFAPPSPVVPAASPADAAACAALDAYKKRQLEAIESDRQTLTALQDAVSKLNLQKQLDFMPGIGGSLSMQASSPGNAPAPAKN